MATKANREIISLDARERASFSAWLKQEACNNDIMAKQMDGMAGPHLAMLARVQRTEAVAYLLVAKKLDSIEEMTITSGGPPASAGDERESE